jgi:thioredoxin-like negative regulator of GroEL
MVKKLKKRVPRKAPPPPPADPLAPARAALAEGRLAEARALLEGSEDVASRELLAQILMQSNDFDAAAALYGDLGRPDSQALAYVLGHRLEEARDLAARHPLRENVRRAIEVAPFTTQYRLKTARDLLDASRFADALGEVEALIAGSKTGPTPEMLSLRQTCRERLGLA